MQIDNPDELPYYVREGERRVRVRFTSLDANDEAVINAQWAASIYAAMWQHVIQHEQTRQTTLKLVAAEEQDSPILGLLRIGVDLSIYAVYGKLNTQSVLETAPIFRYRVQECGYSNIGKALVARLIAESVWQGHGGALIVSPRQPAIPFYLHLGFRPSSRNSNHFFIRAEAGIQLLNSVLIGREDK